MENKLARGAALMLLIICSTEMHCKALTVDPPENIRIIDPGHLGHLEITWSPPASLNNITECTKLYQLEYFNPHNSWSTIRTTRRTYTAQFDLMKDVRVRVYTLLKGLCTNGTWMKSTNYTELVQKPPRTGLVGSAVKDFNCVFYNMEYLTCSWRGSGKMAGKSQQNLYYWHKELEQTEECPKYQISDGVRSGCDFTDNPLPDFTDINFCVNGSSPEGPLKPKYFYLQIQNHVKLNTAEGVRLQTGSAAQLELQWKNPAGRVPGHCLEWEVENSQEGSNGITVSLISTKQMSFVLPAVVDNERNCLRVRSRMNKYCAEKNFWSDWSQQICHPAETP